MLPGLKASTSFCFCSVLSESHPHLLSNSIFYTLSEYLNICTYSGLSNLVCLTERSPFIIHLCLSMHSLGCTRISSLLDFMLVLILIPLVPYSFPNFVLIVPQLNLIMSSSQSSTEILTHHELKTTKVSNFNYP